MKPEQLQDWFDEDPTENLRIENEIAKLKMQAERGAHFVTHGDLPPEIEAIFLQNVEAFEKAWEQAKMVTVYDFLKQPPFVSADEIEENDLPAATDNLLLLLNEKNISIHRPDNIDPRLFYRFLTGEFFQMEIEDVDLPAFVRYFDYYEFHPDHQRDMKICAERFLDNWFRRNVDGLRWDLDDSIVLPKSPPINRDESLALLHRHFDQVVELKAGHFQTGEVKFQWDIDSDSGVGHVDGVLFYETENENHESKAWGGPFMIYLSNHFGCWRICYFEIPGFSWGS